MKWCIIYVTVKQLEQRPCLQEVMVPPSLRVQTVWMKQHAEQAAGLIPGQEMTGWILRANSLFDDVLKYLDLPESPELSFTLFSCFYYCEL